MIVYANGKLLGTNPSGETEAISSAQQGNITKIYINTDNIEGQLDTMIVELKKLAFQMAMMTDTVLLDADVGDRE